MAGEEAIYALEKEGSRRTRLRGGWIVSTICLRQTCPVAGYPSSELNVGTLLMVTSH